MKKFILSLFALVGVAGTVSAQDVKLTVADVDAAPGQTVTATLNFECPADKYTGMQIWLAFDPAEVISVEDAGAVTGAEGVKYSFKDGTVNYAFGLDATFTSSTINVTFTVDDSVDPGDVINVKVTGQLEGYGVEDAAINGSFNVNVNSYITLDENSTVEPEATGSNVDIKVKRTIKAGEWSTICLPFAMSADKLTAAFGDYVLASLDEYSVDRDAEDNITAVNLNFVENKKALVAGTPYIIKINGSDDVKEFDVNAKITWKAANLNTEISDTDPETGEDVFMASMKGVLNAGVVPEKSMFISNNQFYYSVGKTKIKAFRAYFTFADLLPGYDGATSRIKINVTDDLGNQTEIKNADFLLNDGEYYDLKGQRVETPSKGIYIKDGKKVVVK